MQKCARRPIDDFSTYPEYYHLPTDIEIRIGKIIDTFAAELAAAQFPKAKADKLIEGIASIEIEDGERYLRMRRPGYNISSAIPDIIDVLSDVGLTADDVSVILTAGYKAFYVTNTFDSYPDILAAANAYMQSVETRYAGDSNAAILASIKDYAANRYISEYLNDENFDFIVDDEITEAQYNELRALINSLAANTLPEYAVAITEVDAEDEPDEKPNTLLDFVKDAYEQLLINRAAYKTVNDKLTNPEYVVGDDLSTEQYNELSALINSLVATEDQLPAYDVAITEIDATDDPDEKPDTLLAFVTAVFDTIDLYVPVAIDDVFVDAEEKYDDISYYLYLIDENLWSFTLSESNYKPATNAAYKYISDFYNGVAADEDNGIEEFIGYKEICPTTKATIPADYKGLTKEWYQGFLAEIEYDKLVAEELAYADQWYASAYATAKYVASATYEPQFIISDSLNAAILDVIKPTVEMGYKLVGALSSLEKFTSDDWDGSVNKDDISAILDSLDITLDEFTVFINNNGAKLTTLAAELRKFALNYNFLSEDTMVFADYIDSAVNAGPEIAKLVKIVIGSVTDEVIDGIEKTATFNYYSLEEGDGYINATKYMAVLLQNVLNNPAFDTKDEILGLIDNIIEKSSGFFRTDVNNFFEELFYRYDSTKGRVLSEYYELLDWYYESYDWETENFDGFIEYFIDTNDLSVETLNCLTVVPYEIIDGESVYTAASVAAFRNDMLFVLNSIGDYGKQIILNAVEYYVVDPLFYGYSTITTGYDSYNNNYIQMTKSSFEWLDAIANADFILSFGNEESPSSEYMKLMNYISGFSSAGNEYLIDVLTGYGSYAAHLYEDYIIDAAENDADDGYEFIIDAVITDDLSQKIVLNPDTDTAINFVYEDDSKLVVLKTSQKLYSVYCDIYDGEDYFVDRAQISYDSDYRGYVINPAMLLPGFTYTFNCYTYEMNSPAIVQVSFELIQMPE